jgi:hypothetical protein
MIHLPFNLAVAPGKNNIIALGNLDNKEILVHCAYVYAEDMTIRVLSVKDSNITGGRDVSEYAKSAYLGEDIKMKFDAATGVEIEEAELIKICKSEEVVEAEDGITIPSNYYMVLQVDAPAEGRVVGTLSWDVREANEVL